MLNKFGKNFAFSSGHSYFIVHSVHSKFSIHSKNGALSRHINSKLVSLLYGLSSWGGVVSHIRLSPTIGTTMLMIIYNKFVSHVFIPVCQQNQLKLMIGFG